MQDESKRIKNLNNEEEIEINVKENLEKILSGSEIKHKSFLKQIQDHQLLSDLTQDILFSNHYKLSSCRNIIDYNDIFSEEYFKKLTFYEKEKESKFDFSEEGKGEDVKFGDFKFLLYCYLHEDKISSPEFIEMLKEFEGEGYFDYNLAVCDFLWWLESSNTCFQESKKNELAESIFWNLSDIPFESQKLDKSSFLPEDIFNFAFVMLKYRKNFYSDYLNYKKFVGNFFSLTEEHPSLILKERSLKDIYVLIKLVEEEIEENHNIFLTGNISIDTNNYLTQLFEKRDENIDLIINESNLFKNLFFLFFNLAENSLLNIEEIDLEISILFIIVKELYSSNSFNLFDITSLIFEKEEEILKILKVLLKSNKISNSYLAKQFLINNKYVCIQNKTFKEFCISLKENLSELKEFEAYKSFI